MKKDKESLGKAIQNKKDTKQEEKLFNTASRYKALLNAIPDIIMEVDNNKIYTWANQAGYDFFGNDVIGKEASCYFEGEQETYKNVQPIFNGSEDIYYVESWQRRKDNKKRLLGWWCSVLKDENGNITGALSTAHDITELKNAEEALIKSEEKFRIITSNTPDHIIMHDSDLKYTFIINPQLGLTEADMLGKTDFDILNKDEAEYLTSVKRNVIETGKPFHLETSLLNIKNETEFFDGNFIPQFDHEGKANGLIGYFRNVTKQKQFEIALSESEERYRRVINVSPDAIILHFEGKIIFVNQTTLEKIGAKKQEEIIGRTAIEFVHPDDREAAILRISEMYKSNEPAPLYEERMIKMDGSILYVEVAATLIPYNGKKASLVVLRDITDRKLAESKQRESEERYGLFFKNSMDAILLSSPDSHVYSANPAACEMFQMTEEEICNAGRSGLVDIEDPRLPLLLEERKQKGKAKGELFMRKKDGAKFPAEITSSLFYDSNGQLRSSMIIRDITDRKHAEKTIIESRSLYLSFIEQLPNPVFRKDKEGRYILVNSEFCKLKNLKEEDIIGRKPMEIERLFNSGQKRQDLADKYATLGEDIHKLILKTGKSYEEEEEYYGSKDNILYMQVKRMPVINSNGNIIGSQGIMFDITERKNAEQELQNRYNLLHKLTAQVPGVVYQYRLYPDGRSAFPVASSGMWDIYEVTPEDVREDASPVFTRLHPDDYDMIVETINESAKNLTLYHSEFRVILPQQGIRWRLCDAKPERLEDGSTLWYGIISDITERKQAEEELKKYRNHLEELVNERTADLEQKNKELEKFNELFVGREFRIKELKDKIKKLEEQIKNNKT
ncbi:MAG: PAS domain S-box protein [Prolixibacteraceae bacterium]|nr:PAS domain S-box protein [Prolixibacteraceae bacterium]